jgi:hypothetical protein
LEIAVGLARMKYGPGLGWGPATAFVIPFSFAACAVQTSHALAVESRYPRIEKGLAAALEKLVLVQRKAGLTSSASVTARVSARE